jgi:GntR family transcriptional regulator, rspAB operon transcriptional repressor
MAQLRRVQKTTSVTQKTYRSLERAIAQNRLVPGQVLVIGDLADELGVSRTPVREALLMLEKAGLVEMAHGRVTVAELSLGYLDEVFEFREAIESFCLEKVAQRAIEPELRALRDTVAGHRGTSGVAAADAEAAAADLRFHRSIVQLAGNERLLAAWDHLATHLQRFWQDGHANLDRVSSDIDQCLAIVDAVEAGDVLAASRVLKEHLRQTKASLAVWQRVQQKHA